MRSKKKTIKICVVIPAFNEQATINDVVKKVTVAFAISSFDADILVINDGSEDATSQYARSAGAIVIDHLLNSGAGAATATGLSYANKNGYRLAVTMDADGQHSVDDVIRGLEITTKKDVDLLIGSRLIDSNGMSRVKILGNKGLSFITFVLFGVSSTDSQSGLRVYSRKALEELRWETTGYEFCSEMLWRAKQLKLKIDEYAISAIYTEYSKSKGQNNWNAVNIVKSLVQRRIAEMFS
jgi:glycosyltransferase involved in cell wall biosynthesis